MKLLIWSTTTYFTINSKSTAYPTSYYCGLVPLYQIVNRESVLTSLYLLGRNSTTNLTNRKVVASNTNICTCNDLITCLVPFKNYEIKQDVALTDRNRTGSPCNVGRPTAHRRRAMRPAAGRPARRQRYRRRQTTTTEASLQNNTGPLGGPVITFYHAYAR